MLLWAADLRRKCKCSCSNRLATLPCDADDADTKESRDPPWDNRCRSHLSIRIVAHMLQAAPIDIGPPLPGCKDMRAGILLGSIQQISSYQLLAFWQGLPSRSYSQCGSGPPFAHNIPRKPMGLASLLAHGPVGRA